MQLRLPLVVALLLTLLALPGWSTGSCCCTRRAQEVTEAAPPANLPPCCAARLQRLRTEQADNAEPGIRSRCDCQIEPTIPAVDRQKRWDGSSLKRQIELFTTIASSTCVRLDRLTVSQTGQVPETVPILVDLERLCRSLT